MADNKLMIWMQMSVDGYASGPEGAFDWPQVGEELQSTFVEKASEIGTFVYGRHVFEMMAGYWPIVGQLDEASRLDEAFAEIWLPVPKAVFSRTLRAADYHATVHSGDLTTEVAALKAASDGDLACFGGPTLVHQLSDAGLVDEYRIFVHPVALGGGTPLFPPRAERLPLTLLESRVYDGNVTHLQYAAG